jgi:penicillin-insensitive murein endopeptidase
VLSTQSLGFYSGGCLSGAKALPLETSNLQVMRVSRNRYYGHPVLIQTILDLANTLEDFNASLLVSDLGQPRGGPMPFGHASHQNGLDADIWYWEHPEQRQRSLTTQERNELPMISMLNSNGVVDPKKFNRAAYFKVLMAAQDPRVQRIFVNPAIKTYLCSKMAFNQRSWLHKLRPWPGHDAHFHIRLYCPKGNSDCEPQPEQPAGDGCAELLPPVGTFKEGDADEHESQSDSSRLLVESFFAGASDPLPPVCQSVLKAPSSKLNLAPGTKIEPTNRSHNQRSQKWK